tara:strand:- start:4826 stop:5077 length:252 start_codon:yes stop_codon:yes gene_type:complete
MGGANCPRDERPLRPYMIEREQSNRYGELVKVLKGIWDGVVATITRQYQWIVRPRLVDQGHQNTSEDGIGESRALSNAPPLRL